MRRISIAATLVILVAAATTIAGAGCSHTKKSRMKNPNKLRQQVRGFHRFLRWEMIRKASKTVSPDFRHRFLGRYEEYGDDLDIVDLEVTRVDEHDDEKRLVEVEQKWIVDPDPTVRKDDFIEIWKRTSDGWFLTRRLEEKEWRRRRDGDSEGADETDGPAESPPSSSSQETGARSRRPTR